MDAQLNAIGYVLGASKYTPHLGYSGLKVIISGMPSQRFFDVKMLQIPTFNGRYYRKEQVTRHDTEPGETFQVSLGEIKMVTHAGETMRLFSFGGKVEAFIEMGDVCCVYTSNAPLFSLENEPVTPGGVLADEVIDLLAEAEVKYAHHEDDLYLSLAKYDPYQLFLACLVSLRNRAESIQSSRRREGYHTIVTNINRAVQIVQNTDGWDGHSPSLEDLVARGGA